MKRIKNLTALMAVLVCTLIVGCNDQSFDTSKVAFRIASVTDKGVGIGNTSGKFNEAFLGVTELEFVVPGGSVGKTAGDDKDDKDKDKDKDDKGDGHDNHDDDEEEDDDEDDGEDEEDDEDDGDDDNEADDTEEDGENEEGSDTNQDTDGSSSDGENNNDSGSEVVPIPTPIPAPVPTPVPNPVPTNRNMVFKGGFIVDLLNGTSTPDFGVAEVFPGTYQRVRLKLGPVLPGGKSILISTTLMSEALGEVKVIEFSLQGELQILVENANSFTLKGGDFKQFLVLLDLNALFQWVDLVQAVPDEHGIIAINEKSNPALAAQIKGRLSQVIRVVEN
jgi:hypothetical protein